MQGVFRWATVFGGVLWSLGWTIGLSQAGTIPKVVYVGGEFQANTTPGWRTDSPAIAGDSSGNFVVVWSGAGRSGSDQNGIFGQRFDSQGNGLGGEFQINSSTTSVQSSPEVDMSADGRYVVAWKTPDSRPRGIEKEIAFRPYSSNGLPVASEGFLEQTPAHPNGGLYFREKRNVDVFQGEGGEFTIAWESFINYVESRTDSLSATRSHQLAPPETSGNRQGCPASSRTGEIYFQRFLSDGSPLQAAAQVNRCLSGSHQSPRISGSESGALIIVWKNFSSFLGRLASSQGDLGEELSLSQSWLSHDVALRENGDFLVVWNTRPVGQSEPSLDIQGQRYASDGTQQGTVFTVSEAGASGTGRPRIGLHGDGSFTVVWNQGPTDNKNILGRLLQSDGTPTGSVFQVNEETSFDQRSPTLLTHADGSFVVSWVNVGQKGNANSVKVRRLGRMLVEPQALPGPTSLRWGLLLFLPLGWWVFRRRAQWAG